MKPLLFLAHRIPYPPTKGDKIRSYHLLKHLARDYRIYMGAFVDENDDWQYQDDVAELCEKTCLRPLNPWLSKIRSLSGFVTSQALTLPYYCDRVMQLWVNEITNHERIGTAVIFSSSMAQYVDKDAHKGLRKVIDFVDVDSDKWLQYSKKKSWPMSRIYSREGERLLQYERRIAKLFDASTFVSADEAEHFKRLAPESASKIDYFNNGVDADYFDPDGDYNNPYSEGEDVVVFTGAMDYWANVDAVMWFSEKVFPLVQKKIPDIYFYIVGANPATDVVRLERNPGIKVTGAVPDIRPYIKYAMVSVAPMRIARGIQNKVLEAMAMAKPVVASKLAAEGLNIEPGKDLVVIDDATSMAESIAALRATDTSRQMGRSARCFVIENYNWEKNLERFSSLITGVN